MEIRMDLSSNTNVNDVIGAVLTIRSKLDEARADFRVFEQKAKADMERLTVWLKEKGDELGTESFRAENGTAYKVTKESFRVGNWDSILDFIQKTDNFQMLEKRISKNATKEIYEDLGALPPGVEYFAEIEYQVRKPSKK